MKIRVALQALVIAASTATASAHHGLDGYDSSKVVQISGVIRKVDVVNPHVRITLETKGADGRATSWEIEMAYPSLLKRRSFDLHLLEVGRQVIVESWLRKDGAMVASGRTLVLADGRRFDIGDNVGWQKLTK